MLRSALIDVGGTLWPDRWPPSIRRLYVRRLSEGLKLSAANAERLLVELETRDPALISPPPLEQDSSATQSRTTSCPPLPEVCAQSVSQLRNRGLRKLPRKRSQPHCMKPPRSSRAGGAAWTKARSRFVPTSNVDAARAVMSFQISLGKAVEVPTEVARVLATATSLTGRDPFGSSGSPMPFRVEGRCPLGGALRATQECHLELHIREQGPSV
jgi:hypothetical protein